MSPIEISLLSFVLMLGGAATGSVLRRALPDHHLDEHAKDIIRLGASLLATISALVLGLLISSANGSFEAQRNEVIPTDRTHDSSAHRRLVMDAILCGVASRSVQALQQASTMAS